MALRHLAKLLQSIINRIYVFKRRTHDDLFSSNNHWTKRGALKPDLTDKICTMRNLYTSKPGNLSKLSGHVSQDIISFEDSSIHGNRLKRYYHLRYEYTALHRCQAWQLFLKLFLAKYYACEINSVNLHPITHSGQRSIILLNILCWARISLVKPI